MSAIKERSETYQAPSLQSLKKRQSIYSVGLRRKKRSLFQAKKRALQSGITITNQSDVELLLMQSISQQVLHFYPDLNDSSLTDLQKIQMLRDLLYQSDLPPKIAHKSLQIIRMTLSITNWTPIGTFIQLGFSDIAISYLREDLPFSVACEAAWIICNLTSGAHQYTEVVVQGGVLEKITSLFPPRSEELANHLLWALGNLTGDCSEYRQELIKLGLIESLKQFINSGENLKLQSMELLAWILSNVCKESQYISDGQVEDVLEMIQYLLTQSEAAPDVWADSVSALSNLAKVLERIQFVLSSGLIDYALQGLSNPSYKIKWYSVILFGNIASGNEEHTDYLLDLDILSKLFPLVKQGIQEVFWLVSNLAAGTINQLWRLIQHHHFSEFVQGILFPDFKIKCEACHILRNILVKNQNDDAVKLQLLPYSVTIAQALQYQKDANILSMLLECVFYLVVTGERNSRMQGLLDNPVEEYLRQSGSLAVIEELDCRMNLDLLQKVTSILDRTNSILIQAYGQIKS